MSDPTETGEKGMTDPRFIGAVDMVRRTGAAEFQIRYQDDEQPVVWIAVVGHRMKDGVPQAEGEINHHEAAAALTPLDAVLRLCEQVMDGGMCAHCKRPSMFEPDFSFSPLDPVIADLGICQTMWDPELSTYRRACEGDQ